MARRGPRGGERARTVPSRNDRHGGRAGAIRVSTRRTDAPPDNPVCGGPRTGKEQRPTDFTWRPQLNASPSTCQKIK
jgi:hypothetical protein